MGAGYFARSIDRHIIGSNEKIQPPAGRVIAYGVLGRLGQRLCPLLDGTIYEPRELWDKAAGLNSSISGTEVKQPQWESLNEQDIIIIFPASPAVAAEVEKELSDWGIKPQKVYRSYELSALFADILFPDIEDKALYHFN